MADKVQKIREEVERIQLYTQSEVLKQVIDYIDEVQKEPVSKVLDIESMIESYKQRLISQVNGMKNSPFVNMCLDSYKHGINEILDTLNLSNIQRTVKNWKEPVRGNLEQVAITAANEDMQGRQIMEKSNENRQLYSRIFRRGFKAGAKWQKEQLKNSAIDATIGYWNHSGLSIDVKLPKDLKEGSKCKILIIKDK